MEPKKNKKADLERMKGLFFQIGLIAAMGLVLTAFQWSKKNPSMDEYCKLPGVNDPFEEEIEKIQSTPAVQQPPPMLQPENLLLVDIDPAAEIDFNFDVDKDIPITPVDIIPQGYGDNVPREEIYESYELDFQAEFMGGGTERFQKWVMENLKYPEIAINNQIQGKVFVKFVVNKSGEISDIQIMRSVDESLDNETIRVIGKSPKWKPAIRKGKTVSVSYQMPVKFQLN